MAPAGTFNTAIAVLNAGADAVYLGGEMFSARAFAKNLTTDELIKVIEYAHIKGKKVYLTVNTLLKNNEITDGLYDYIVPLYLAGLDAVIVQDMGVVSFLREKFEDLDVHMSTQTSISTPEGAMFFRNLGITRVVLSRELSLDKIKEIYEQTGLDLEVFAHGALCYSYSGRCLLSSMIGGRSANRGKCAGPCRLAYTYDNKKEVFLLSLKDLATLSILPDMIEANIASLKIEGRMKQTEYAVGVTSLYRKYIDKYYELGRADYKVSHKDKKMLEALGSRSGFTDGYLTGKRSDMVSLSSPSHKNSDIEVDIDESFVKEKIKAKFTAHIDKPVTLSLEYNDHRVSAEGMIVSPSKNSPLLADTVRSKVGACGDSFFEILDMDIDMDENVFLPASELKKLRRKALDDLSFEVNKDYYRHLS